MIYPNKDDALGDAKGSIYNHTRKLHPADKAEVLREIQGYACEKAMKQEAINEEVGVPERREVSEMDDDGDFVR